MTATGNHEGIPVMTTTDTRPDLSQCAYTTDKGRRCKLTPGHEGKHRMVLRENVAKPPTAKELRAKGLKLDLTMTAVPKGANLGREYKREAAPRDADQVKVDGNARKAYELWQQAGKPKDFDKSPVQRFIIPPEAFDTVIGMLRRATTTGGPVAGKSLQYRQKTHESGNTQIFFRVTDRIVDQGTQNSITGARG